MSSNPFLHAPTPQEDEMEKPFFGIRKSGFRSLWRVKNHVSRLFHDEKREIHRKIVPGIFGNDWVHNLVDFLVSFWFTAPKIHQRDIIGTSRKNCEITRKFPKIVDFTVKMARDIARKLDLSLPMVSGVFGEDWVRNLIFIPDLIRISANFHRGWYPKIALTRIWLQKCVR